MSAPRLGQGMPVDDSWVPRQLADLQRQITELRAARSLEASTIGAGGLTITGGSVTVAGGSVKSSNFDGDLDANTAGSNGWGLGGASGNAVFNNLTLRGGIIGDSALANPIAVAIHNGSATGQTTGTSYSTVYTGTLTTPVGFTRALITCMGSVFTQLASGVGNADILTTRALVGGSAGAEVSQSITAAGGVYVSASPNFARLVTGLTDGQLINVAVQAHGFTGEFQASSTGGSVSANALFLR